MLRYDVHSHVSYQHGTALVMSLIFLLLLTILGITAVNTATLEERMAGNMKDQYIAFQAAESAVRDAETRLAALQIPPATVISPNNDAALTVLEFGAVGDLAEQSATWWTANGEEFGGTTVNLDGVAIEPRFIVEERQYVPDSLVLNAPESGVTFYRVTARGVGSTAAAQAVVQSTFSVHN